MDFSWTRQHASLRAAVIEPGQVAPRGKACGVEAGRPTRARLRPRWPARLRPARAARGAGDPSRAGTQLRLARPRDRTAPGGAGSRPGARAEPDSAVDRLPPRRLQ